MKRLRKWTLRLTLALLALFILLSAGFLTVLRTVWLREQIRTRIIAEVEKATGGKVELQQFDFDPIAMRASVKNFVLRGKEPPSDPPLAHVASIDVGVTVVSFLRRDAYLASLVVEKPQVRIFTFPDGSTNIPGPTPSRKTGRSVFEQFVALSARSFVLKDGIFTYDNQRLPLNLLAENLHVRFGWEREGPRYRGSVSAKPFHFNWPKIAPLQFDTNVELTMDKNGLAFQKAELRRGGSLLQATGTLKDYRSPVVALDTKAHLKIADWVKEMHLPLSREGTADFDGKFDFDKSAYILAGKLRGNGLAVRQELWQITGASATAGVTLKPGSVKLDHLHATALDGSFDGTAEILRWSDFIVRGAVSNVSLEALQQVENRHRPVAWSAVASGPVEVSFSLVDGGVKSLAVATHTVLEPAEGKIPVEGLVNATYIADAGSLSFQNSFLKTDRTRVDFNGVLGDRIRVLLETSDLNDFLPAAALLSDKSPSALPVQLDGGVAHFEGTVSSPLETPRLEGRLSLTQSQVENRKFESIAADIIATSTNLAVRNLRLKQGSSQIEGDARVQLAGWRMPDDSRFVANLDLRQTSIEELLRDTSLQPATAPAPGTVPPQRTVSVNERVPHLSIPITGVATGKIQIEGTVATPSVRAALVLNGVHIDDEAFSRIQFDLKYKPGFLELTAGVAQHAAGRIPFQAKYEHPPGQYDRGSLTFDVSAKDAPLQAIGIVTKQRPDVTGRADVALSGKLRIEQGQPGIDVINGTVALRQIGVNKQIFGDLELRAKTAGERISMAASGTLLGSAVTGTGEWQLTGDANGLGHLELGSLTLDKLNGVLRAFGNTRDIPFDGKFQGEIVVSGPLRKPNTLKARANLTQLELLARAEKGQISPQLLEELKLVNNGPVIAEFDSKGLQIIQAQLTGKETNIQVGGNLALGTRNAWNIALRGGLNLGIFQNYVPGLKTSGAAVVNATVRGGLEQPQLGGRMEIKDANVSHRDVPNSIENASGVVVFDRNRALLQNFTAQSGGGAVNLSGFVTFRGQDEAITYRINGQLDRVRIRYPEGASTTLNANVSLTGTSDQSLLSGTVTVLRSGFATHTDLSTALLETSKPVQTPISSTFLRGMQFDVHVVNAPNLKIDTTLTNGVLAEVDLRMRGSPLKPVVLGTVSVTSGEVNFFGTTYRITRGTVSFFNAARIEPILDLDLETTVRAVTVNMNVSGGVDKPYITYRSDPPFQTSEIIALLAVGRTPTGSTVATQTNVTGTATGLFAGTDTLVGQALSAGVSGRLQRFFGVSRVKIDPQLVSVDTTPQARLTIEQQISREITLTYVTNLTGALQQLVRLQWDFRKNWSIAVIRDENGTVGSDIQYKTRFK